MMPTQGVVDHGSPYISFSLLSMNYNALFGKLVWFLDAFSLVDNSYLPFALASCLIFDSCQETWVEWNLISIRNVCLRKVDLWWSRMYCIYPEIYKIMLCKRYYTKRRRFDLVGDFKPTMFKIGQQTIAKSYMTARPTKRSARIPTTFPKFEERFEIK